MLRTISKIRVIVLPTFLVCHYIIKENKDKIKNYCPVVKYNNSKTSSPNTASKKE